MGPAKLLSAAALSSLLITTTQASLSVDMFQPADFPGWKVYQFFWDGGDTGDFSSASMVVDLPQGDVYHNPNPPSLIVPVPPQEKYDTWVGIPGDSTTSIAGGAGDLGGGAFSLDAPQISVAWYNTSTLDTGYVQIAQVTVSNDAIGTWKIQSAGELLEGIIPEPATLVLFGLAIPALLYRQR